MIKSRHISFEETLRSLENEYISNLIRSKIYLLSQDIRHYKKVMGVKREKIESIGKRKELKTMFNDFDLKENAFSRVIPVFGFPYLVYNERFHQEDKKFTFPYSGTVVQLPGGKYGHSDYVAENKIHIRMMDNSFKEFNLFDVRRLSPVETDMYYYYTPGAKFQTSFGQDSCVLKEVDLKKKICSFEYESDGLMVKNKSSFSEVSRILEL